MTRIRRIAIPRWLNGRNRNKKNEKKIKEEEKKEEKGERKNEGRLLNVIKCNATRRVSLLGTLSIT